MAKCDFYTEIDGIKLINAIKARNLLAIDISERMGHEKSFISSVIKNGKIHNSDLTLLDYMFNIKKEEVVKNKEPEPVKEKSPAMPVMQTENIVNLSELIEEAVYRGVKRALSEI